MIVLALSLTVLILFLGIVVFILAYSQEYKKAEALTKSMEQIKEFLSIAKKISLGSKGYFQYHYFDTGLNVENTINIPFFVEKFTINHDKIAIRFIFEQLYSENKSKGINIIFDDNTIKYLKMLESDWYDINSELIIWQDSEYLDVSYYEESKYSEKNNLNSTIIELTPYEKQDIRGFLKFSTISEETKENIKTILGL